MYIVYQLKKKRVSQNELFSSWDALFVWNQVYFHNCNNEREAYLYFETASSFKFIFLEFMFFIYTTLTLVINNNFKKNILSC